VINIKACQLSLFQFVLSVDTLFRLLGAFAKLRKVTASFVMSFRPHVSVRPPSWNNPAHTGWIFMKFDI